MISLQNLWKNSMALSLVLLLKLKDACNAESCISGTWLGTEY